MRTDLPTAALMLVLAGAAQADIVPLSGAQRSHGNVYVRAAGINESESFDMSPPDALASWSPAPVEIMASALDCTSRLNATYTSMITPNALSVATSAETQSLRNSHTIFGGFSYAQTFEMQLEITEAAWYRISARIQRHEPTAWGYWSPASVRLAAHEGPVIMQLVINRDNKRMGEKAEQVFGPQSHWLEAGTYELGISDMNSWQGGNDYIAASSVSFSMEQTASACACDWNDSGILNSQDLWDYLADFFAGNADTNADGVTNSQDFFEFLTCFFAGC